MLKTGRRDLARHAEYPSLDAQVSCGTPLRPHEKDLGLDVGLSLILHDVFACCRVLGGNGSNSSSVEDRLAPNYEW